MPNCWSSNPGCHLPTKTGLCESPRTATQHGGGDARTAPSAKNGDPAQLREREQEALQPDARGSGQAAGGGFEPAVRTAGKTAGRGSSATAEAARRAGHPMDRSVEAEASRVPGCEREHRAAQQKQRALGQRYPPRGDPQPRADPCAGSLPLCCSIDVAASGGPAGPLLCRLLSPSSIGASSHEPRGTLCGLPTTHPDPGGLVQCFTNCEGSICAPANVFQAGIYNPPAAHKRVSRSFSPRRQRHHQASNSLIVPHKLVRPSSSCTERLR
mmetsp:Transcript_19478/g.42037  ORF Transcript_19478/g.42037 Transcript_19478/m.42037 type:complete len:270 (+) Transcript_19478:374-1183(+)